MSSPVFTPITWGSSYELITTASLSAHASDVRASLDKYLFLAKLDQFQEICEQIYALNESVTLASKILLVAFAGVTSLPDVLRLCYAFGLKSWLLMSSASKLVHVTSYRREHQWGNHSNNPFYVNWFTLTFSTVFSNEWAPAWTTICSVSIIVAVSSILTRIRVTRIKDWQINQRKHT